MLESFEIRGATAREQLAARREETRLIPFPDGQLRHITMQGRHWQAMDQLIAEFWDSVEQFLAGMHDLTEAFAREMGISYEEAVRHDLPHYIWGGFVGSQMENRQPANGNCPELAALRELARDRAPNLHYAWLSAT